MFDYRYNCLKVNAEYKPPFGCVFLFLSKSQISGIFCFFILPNLNGGFDKAGRRRREIKNEKNKQILFDYCGINNVTYLFCDGV